MKFLAGIALLAATATASPSRPVFSLQVSQDPTAGTSYNGKYIGSYEGQGGSRLDSLAVFDNGRDAANFTSGANGTVNYQAPNGAPWKLKLDSDDSMFASLLPCAIFL